MELIKLSIIFIVILGLLSFRVKLDLAMLAASVLLVIFFSIPISQAAITLLQSVIAWDTISMVLIVWFVMILEGLMSQRGALEKLLDRFNAVFHSKRLNIVAMPMIIGFLPSAGGALFSAPIVEKAAQGEGFSPERMTIINIYYRHVMEVFFPTYASLMMAASITGLSLSRLSTALLPVAIFVMLFGLVLVRGVKHSESPGKRQLWPARVANFIPTDRDVAISGHATAYYSNRDTGCPRHGNHPGSISINRPRSSGYIAQNHLESNKMAATNHGCDCSGL